jgi:transposase
VLALHPNQVAAARDRFRVSGGKSDRFDAFVICELARTDHHRFRVLEPDGDQTKALRALTRGREDLVGTRTALTNQLRAQLKGTPASSNARWEAYQEQRRPAGGSAIRR